MASLGSKALHHGRSLSFPSESHSTTSQFDDNLSRIKSCEATSSSLSSINDKLNICQNLYVIIDDFLRSSHINSQEFQENQILDGYIRLLDACSSVEDLASHTKHQEQDLLSALRRKDAHGIRDYLISRGITKKMIMKSLKNLKCCRGKIIALEKDHESSSVTYMLKEADKVTLSILESLLCYMMGSKGQSFISKLLKSSKVGDVDSEINEFKKMDGVLQMSQEDEIKVKEFMNHLKGIDSNIQLLEQELECLFRKLIKTRVSLLNNLNF